MSDCRSHGLGDCPQHATSGTALLRRQLGGLEADNGRLLNENARLTAALAASEAEVGRLREAVERCADWFSMTSWEFEKKWGREWVDMDSNESIAALRALLAPGADTGAGDSE